ncbi:DNA alkylation repair protein [Agarivorans sp. 1_MG-2023]|uniref:DNA alkylation repair protein n=1 Tax=Agarivorans sp. 1_MG-2023 TaxID=3062634 RepID=UPI0026E2632B|nr:DNA alkylation repair protein [Agarivorans sp. 1_MG-2023]MDO6763312.1 DNA alkylation repair protein [Agarivorans sp. 1_MG-2023]
MEQMLMKNGLAEPALQRISKGITAVYPQFDRERFLSLALDGLEALELKQRVTQIIEVLLQTLPADFSETAKILSELPKHWDRGDPDDSLRGFAVWPVTDYVAVAGINDPQRALPVLALLTPLFSAEFAIRPFIEKYPELTWSRLHDWCEDEDEHIRRLASEGCRPRLPWGAQLKGLIGDPTPILALLDKLKADDSLYVRRSVANNLNDISKDHPEQVLALCQRWQSKASEEVEWVIKHATRSLVKQGHPLSFPLLGYTAKPQIELEEFALLKPQVKMGDSLTFALAIRAKQAKQKFVLDFAVHFVKANGKTAAKVFKLKNLSLNKDEMFAIEKQHSFKAISTRKYYPGEHFVALHINGQEIARLGFELTQD